MTCGTNVNSSGGVEARALNGSATDHPVRAGTGAATDGPVVLRRRPKEAMVWPSKAAIFTLDR